jgi:hypothetical protein
MLYAMRSSKVQSLPDFGDRLACSCWPLECLSLFVIWRLLYQDTYQYASESALLNDTVYEKFSYTVSVPLHIEY